METFAYIKYLHISPKKMKPVAGAIVGFSPVIAMDKLLMMKTKSASILSKAVKSAYSNAKNNFKLDTDDLFIKKVEILKGPIAKRWQPVSRGMAHSIKKRTSHLKVVIAEKEKQKKIQPVMVKAEKANNDKHIALKAEKVNKSEHVEAIAVKTEKDKPVATFSAKAKKEKK